MLRKKQVITVLMAMFIAIGALNAQEKYALIIAGDYQPGIEIPDGDKWNNGEYMDPDKGYDEFWNDTYLMWELLYNHPTGYSNDNIEVLFAEGIDYTFEDQDDRYKSEPNYPVDHITDAAATKTNVMGVLDDLANINEEDYLFVWIMSNGGNTEPAENVWSYVYLWDYDPAYPNEGRLYDYELKEKLDLIPAHKKVVIVQAPNSGCFATTLADENTIVFTSSHIDEPAKRANDTPYQENEEWGGIQYHHGEFGYHIYSPLNGEDPGYNTSYGPTSFADANENDDDVISIEEGIDWEFTYGNAVETPVVSDIGSISPVTSVQYSTLLFDDIYEDKNFMGIIGLTGPPIGGAWISTEVRIMQGNVTFEKAKLYFLDDTYLYQTLNNPGILKIGKYVSLFGTSDNSGLVSYSDIQIGTDVLFSGFDGQRWGGLAAQNPDLYLERVSFIDCGTNLNTIPNLSVINCDFIRARLYGCILFNNTEISETDFINSYADLQGYGTGSLEITNCHFFGPGYFPTDKFGLYVKSFKNYVISNNMILNYGYGLKLYDCSGPRDKRDIFNNCINNNYKNGIFINRSYANIFNNDAIYENYIGIECINYSNVEIEGNSGAHHISETQCIFDNELNQIRTSLYSFPYLKWNAIWFDYNTDPLIYWDLGDGDPATADITDNFWGAPEFFDPNEDFYPTNAFNWEPVWDLAYGPPPGSGEDELLYESAGLKAEQGDFTGAKNDYMQLVSDYPESRFAEAALKEMLPLEKYVSNDYTSLQQYYSTDPTITGNTELTALANNLANWCNVEMEDYSSAIQYYNDILSNPPSYHDSVFALFDLNYIDFLMNNTGYKSGMADHSLIFDLTAKEKDDKLNEFYADLLFPQKELSKTMKENLSTLQSGTLLQNVPNPFTSETQLWYKLEEPAKVAIYVYDYTGKLVRTFNQGNVTGGIHRVLFTRKTLTPGIYFYTLEINGIKTDMKKMVSLK